MLLSAFLDALYDCPVVAAVKDGQGLELALSSNCKVLFLLFGSLPDIHALVARGKEAGKFVVVHLDLVEGLSPRDAAVDYLAKETQCDGIITTRPQVARRAKALGLIAIQRFFLLDSMAVESMLKQLEQDCCDLIEVLPGCMPKVLRGLSARCRKPLVAGGLIRDKEDVTGALSAGAVAVSTSCAQAWDL